MSSPLKAYTEELNYEMDMYLAPLTARTHEETFSGVWEIPRTTPKPANTRGRKALGGDADGTWRTDAQVGKARKPRRALSPDAHGTQRDESQMAMGRKIVRFDPIVRFAGSDDDELDVAQSLLRLKASTLHTPIDPTKEDTLDTVALENFGKWYKEWKQDGCKTPKLWRSESEEAKRKEAEEADRELFMLFKSVPVELFDAKLIDVTEDKIPMTPCPEPVMWDKSVSPKNDEEKHHEYVEPIDLSDDDEREAHYAELKELLSHGEDDCICVDLHGFELAEDGSIWC